MFCESELGVSFRDYIRNSRGKKCTPLNLYLSNSLNRFRGHFMFGTKFTSGRPKISSQQRWSVRIPSVTVLRQV